MKHIHLDTHSDRCHRNRLFCEHSPNYGLFCIKSNYFLISWHMCIAQENDYDFKKSIVDSILRKSKVVQTYEVNRGVNVNKELKAFIRQQAPLRKHAQEANHIYADNANKQYAITTCAPFVELLGDAKTMYKEFSEAKDWLTKHGYEHLHYELQTLHTINSMWYTYDQAIISKTVDELVKQIHKYANN